MLSPGSAGSVGIDPDVLIPDFDIHILFNVRHDIARDKRGLTLSGRIERRDPDQPVDPHLALQEAVCIFPVHLEGNGLDSRLISIQGIQDLHGQPLLVDPSGIHPVKHAAPVAGLCPACPGVKRYDRVIPIIRAGQERADAHLLKGLLELIDIRPHIIQHGRVIILIRHIDQHQCFFVEILKL